MISGSSVTDPNAFDGLATLLPASDGQVMYPAAAGGSLTLSLLDQLIDLVLGGKPDILLMSKRTRRKLKSLLAASAHYVESGETSFGRRVMMYDGIPVFVSDFINDTEAANDTTGNTFSSIYAIHFGVDEGLCGITNGGIDVMDLGPLETKDAMRVRVRWYVGLAELRHSAIARMNGVSAT